MQLTSNVMDTALIFEGGGMRGAYTAAVVTTLLQTGLHFNYVAGISAGSSHTVNYVSRAPERARRSFVDFADDPRFGSWWTWLQGKGMFNAKYIYERVPLPDGVLPLDFDTFRANPADYRIGGFDVDAGETVFWTRDDVHEVLDLMRRVRASSSIPLVMPPVMIDGRMYVDGALGAGGGIPLGVAQRDGFTKFFVVLTREREYVKEPYRHPRAWHAYYRKHPAIADGILGRAAAYNAVREELFELERAGRAVVFFPEHMTVENRTHDVAALQAAYDAGLDQARRELPRWKEFLGVGVG
ncbi:MAG: patatin family protein [Propionibacteriaceae bacterium]|jgi:predicted patatin/cPLA2 family phospholipase|nr:patatin family protein [Propionibacteriaceae bacterium]